MTDPLESLRGDFESSGFSASNESNNKKKESPSVVPSFLVAKRELDDAGTDPERKAYLKAHVEKMVEDVKNFDDGEFLGVLRSGFKRVLRENNWDNVYQELFKYANNMESQLIGRTESTLNDHRWEGMVRQAVRAEASRVILAGIKNKMRNVDRDGFRRWLSLKEYSEDEIKRFSETAKNKHVFDLAPEKPENLVGKDLPVQKPVADFESRLRFLTEAGGFKEKTPLVRELPLHIGAVFEGGKNEYLVEDPELIATLDSTDPEDRKAFIFKNLRAFNYRFVESQGMSTAWLGAVKIWEGDFSIANEKHSVPESEKKLFLSQLRAMMAVTASARAMESSAGAATSYRVLLTGGERGNNDWQDIYSEYLLHADPEKLNLVIEDPLVKLYYDRLMKDAGLKSGKDYEWRTIPKPGQTDSEKTIQLPSRVEFVFPESKFGLIRTKSPLIQYLEKSAKKGGFQSYIEEVLVPQVETPDEVDDDIKMSAARLACDAFLVDKFSRWEFSITEGGKISLDLQPNKQWGGDPLKSILKPTFLPRLKGVYSNEDSVVLDIVDQAFRPEDYFGEVKKHLYEEDPTVRLISPSLVTNLKTFARYNEALDTFLGGPMGAGISAWTGEMMGKNLPQVIDLLTQVYGSQKTKTNNSEDVFVGKHIVGAMAMRLLYAKVLATSVESSRPDFGAKMRVLFDPENRNRPFLEVMQFLYGPDLDGKRGFIQSLIGGRLRLVIKNNMFDAEEKYKKVWDILQTNDQRSRGGKALGIVGLLLDAAQSAARATGVVKR